tara:strand:- start:25867 stop:26415 length:549 start_codon:yes stop_codon:yes gene_type:complete
VKFRDILTTAATVTGLINPALGAAIGAVNGLLPKDKQLPITATGNDVAQMVEQLPPEQRASLMEREIDLAIAREDGWTERYKAMTQADGQETRAAIVRMMARVLVFEILAFTVLFFWQPDVVNSEQVWLIFGVLTGTPATVLLNYFGNLRREHAQRQASISGQPLPKGLGAVLGKVVAGSRV